MPNLAHSTLIAMGDFDSIQSYSKEIEVENSLLVLDKLIPAPDIFTEDYWNNSEANKNEIKKWRYSNWGTMAFPLVHSEIIENYPGEYALHIMTIATHYCPPSPFINKLIERHQFLNFINEIEFESSETILEYYDNSKKECSTIFRIEDRCDTEFWENLTPKYLEKFDLIKINNRINRALSHTSCGKILLELKYPDGIPIFFNSI
jgi:hypothetical protein